MKVYLQEFSPDGSGILYRLTAPVGGEGGNDAKRNIDQASEKAEREGKSAYNKIKDSIGGFFGQAKETGCDPSAHNSMPMAVVSCRLNCTLDCRRLQKESLHLCNEIQCNVLNVADMIAGMRQQTAPMTRHIVLPTRQTRASTTRVRRGAISTRARTALERCRRRARTPSTPPRTPPFRPSKKLSWSLDCPLKRPYVIAPHVMYSQDRGEPRRRLE